MEWKVYAKRDIIRNWWAIVLRNKMYIAELKTNVYLLQKLNEYKYKCVEAIVSKHLKAKLQD